LVQADLTIRFSVCVSKVRSMNEKRTLCEHYGTESVESRKGTSGIDVFKEADDFDRLLPCVRLSVDDVMF
jgi:hypothetical protein